MSCTAATSANGGSTGHHAFDQLAPQVAPAPDRVLVRDSKNPTGPALTIPLPAWQTFLTTLAS